MRIEGLVSDLLSQLESEVSPGDRAVLLRVLQQWLKTHLASWNPQMRERWALDGLAAMDLPRGEPWQDAGLLQPAPRARIDKWRDAGL